MPHPLQRRVLAEISRERREADVRGVGRAAAGEQGRAVGPHEPGDVGAAHMMVKEPFHDPQQGIVQKRAPLHQHAVPKFGGRAQAQDFVQRVAGHGVAQPGGDVADVRAFLLRLFDLGIHEHGTARSQIHGMPGEQGGAHERLHAQVEAAGECFEEGPASGGAGFVEGHARDEAVPRLEALHILAADVDDVRRIGHEAAGGLQVGHRFHVGGQRAEGGLRELRAVARGYAGLDPRAFGQLRLNLLDDVDGGGQRAAFVGRIRGPYDFSIVVHQRRFDGGGTGVYAQEVRSLGSFERALMDMLAMMPFVECGAIRLGSEQRRHGRSVGRQVFQFVQSCQKVGAGSCFVMLSQGRHHPDRPAMRHRMPHTGERRSEQ